MQQRAEPPSADPFVTKMLTEHHRLSCRVEELEHELLLLKKSRSWRVTQPLRTGRLCASYLRSLFELRAHHLRFTLSSGVLPCPEGWRRTEPACHFVIASSRGRMPVGWTRFELDEAGPATPRAFALYVDCGEGFSERDRVDLYFSGHNPLLVRLPRLVRTLRIDPIDAQETFSLVGFTVRELSAARVILGRMAASSGARDGGTVGEVAAGMSLLREGGLLAFEQQSLGLPLLPRQRERLYRRWIRRYCRVESKMEEARPLRPLISILMPVYNTPEKWLRKAFESVLSQSYRHWELCVVDDKSTRPSVRAVLEEFSARDQRIRVQYRERNGHISESSNTALQMAQGEFIALMDHDDELAPEALECVVQELNLHPQCDLIFSDEDRISDDGERIDPYFKNGYDLELLRGQNLISHLGVYRTSIARAVGGFRSGFEGSQDWDFALRFVEQTTPERIRHIPKVLYHWRWVPGTVSFSVETKRQAFEAAEAAVSEHLRRRGIPASAAWNAATGVVELRYSAGRVTGDLAVVRFGASLSSLTEAVAASPGKYLLLLDEHTQPTGEDFRDEIVGRFSSRAIGAVAGAVWNADGRLRNAGYLLCEERKLHALEAGTPRVVHGYFRRAVLPHEVFAADLNGVAVERGLLLEVLKEAVPSDAEALAQRLCAAIRKQGLAVVWTPRAEFHSSENRNVPVCSSMSCREDSGVSQSLRLNLNLSPLHPGGVLAFPPRR